MAVASISEYAELAIDKDGRVIPAVVGSPIAVQVLSLSGTSAAISNAFNSATKMVRIATDTNIHFVFADSPTATTSHEILTVGVEYRGIDGATGTKLAAKTTA